MHYTVGHHISGSSYEVLRDYSTAFLNVIMQKMKADDIDGVIHFMEEYQITPDLLKEHLLDL